MKLALPDYLGGVRFECTQCGACCTGAPGRVQVSRAEVDRIVEFLGEKARNEGTDWVYSSGVELRLRERDNGDCVFYKENRCAIHEVKPGQCRRYPFWFRNVRSEAAWARTCAECPGIGEGPVVNAEEILGRIEEDLQEK